MENLQKAEDKVQGEYEGSNCEAYSFDQKYGFVSVFMLIQLGILMREGCNCGGKFFITSI
jgi:hypothetical protein